MKREQKTSDGKTVSFNKARNQIKKTKRQKKQNTLDALKQLDSFYTDYTETDIQYHDPIDGLQLRGVPGDGHCLFHAVALCTEKNIQSIRQEVADHMQANIHNFMEYFAGTEHEFLSHINAIRDTNEYGDHIEIVAIQRVFQRPIIVIQKNDYMVIPDNIDEYKGEPVFVYYHGEDFQHYDSYKVREGFNARDILTDLRQKQTTLPSINLSQFKKFRYFRKTIQDSFSIFNLNREDVYQTLSSDEVIFEPEKRRFLLTGIKNLLMQDDFNEYLCSQKNYKKQLKEYKTYKLAKINNEKGEIVNRFKEKLKLFAFDPDVQRAYLEYTLKDKYIEGEQAHPCILQTLAYALNISLYCWQYDDNEGLVEHESYKHVTPQNSTQRIDLVFENNNDHYQFIKWRDEVLSQVIVENGNFKNNKDKDEHTRLIKTGSKGYGTLPCGYENTATVKLISCYDYFVLWVERRSVLKLLTEYFFISRRLNETSTISRLQDPVTARRSLRIDGFFAGLFFTTSVIWPVSFSTVLLKDIISYYALPEDRYGNTIAEILLGFAGNKQASTSWLVNTYSWPIIWLTLPSIIGLMNVFWRLNWYNTQTYPSKTIVAFHLFSKQEITFIWQEAKLIECTLLPKLRFDLEQGNILKQWAAIIRLGNIIDAMSQNILPKNEPRIWSRSNQKLLDLLSSRSSSVQVVDSDADDALLQNALNILQNNANFENRRSMITFLLANKALWSTGCSMHRYLEPLFWLSLIIPMYFNYRYLLTLGGFAWKKITFYASQYQCQSEGKIWRLMQQSGNYECTVCGDWPEVYYPHVFKAQSCINDLLHSPQTAQRIIDGFERIKPFKIHRVNFQQDWLRWTDNDFNQVLHAVQQATHYNYLTLFDISLPLAINNTISGAKASLLGDFLKKMWIEQLSINNFKLNENTTAAIFYGSSDWKLLALEAKSTTFGNGTQILATVLPKLLTLYELNLASCDLTDEQLWQLAPAFWMLPAANMNLAKNLFGAAGIKILLTYLNPIVQHLDISGNNLAAMNMTLLGQHLYHIHTLKTSNINLSDEDFSALVPYLAKSALKSWDITGNDLTEQSMAILSSWLNQTGITDLNVAGNLLGKVGNTYLCQALAHSAVKILDNSDTGFDDEAMQACSTYLPLSQLNSLITRSNLLTAEGIAAFTEILPNSTITNIDLENNNIGDTGWSLLGKVIAQYPNQICYLNIQETGAGPHGGHILAKSLNANRYLQTLLIGNNALAEVMEDFFKVLPHTCVREFNAENCNFLAEQLTILIEVLDSTWLERINLSRNLLGNESIVGFAQKLITPIPHADQLGNSKISLDLTRAIHTAKSNTHLQLVNFDECNGGDEAARALCRIWNTLENDITELYFVGNDVNSVNLESCVISAAIQHKPSLFISLMYALLYYRKTDFSNEHLNTGININHQRNTSLSESIQQVLKLSSLLKNILMRSIMLSLTAPDVGLHALAVICAFRHELWHAALQYLPNPIAIHLRQYNQLSEVLLVEETVEFALRQQHSGTKTMLYDAATVVKKTCSDTSDNSSPTYSKIKAAASGLLALGGSYGAAYALSVLIESGLHSVTEGSSTTIHCVACAAIPLLMNSKRIYQTFTSNYKQQGFWHAVDETCDVIGFSVPGSQFLTQSIQQWHAPTTTGQYYFR